MACLWFGFRVSHEAGCRPGPQSSESLTGVRGSTSYGWLTHMTGKLGLAGGRRSVFLDKWTTSYSCLSVLAIWWPAFPTESDTRKSELEVTVSFMC